VDLPVVAHSKHPVGHVAVEVDMGIQCGPEALLEAHHTHPAARAAAAVAQPRFDDPQEDVQHRAERLGLAMQDDK